MGFKGPMYGFRDAGFGLFELGTREFRGTLYQPKNSLGGRKTLFVSVLISVFFLFSLLFLNQPARRKKDSEEKTIV